MKKTLFSLLLLLAATAASAQTLKGDMNGDGRLTIADVTSLVDVVLGNAPQESADPFAVDPAAVAGTWCDDGGSIFRLNADGTTTFSGAATFKYYPYERLLLLYDAQGRTVKTMVLSEVTATRLRALDYTAGTTTAYSAVTLVSGLTMSQTSLTLNSGATAQLSVTATPRDATVTAVTWSSSDTGVATVSPSGLVTAKAGGSCTITARATDGSDVSATCELTVVQLVTAITLSPTTLALEPDGYQRITATVLPANASNKAVTWSSSDENVAEVTSNGGVAANSVGQCTITCAATDGSGVSATCQVTVYIDRSGSVDGHAYIDLGLPSGTLWATCNIGASSPEDYGDYFAWGETTGYNDGKTTFSWSTYKWCNGSNDTLAKYCNNSSYGTVDNKTELDQEDDAAYVNWGSNWRMPSNEQFAELINSSYTTKEWTTQNGVVGFRITSKTNGNSLFLPAAGWRYDSSLGNAGLSGYYWSRTLGASYPYDARYLYVGSGYIGTAFNNRYGGLSVRPVRLPECADDHAYVDLDLPSGTLWATCNVGADSPEDYGDYFAWGETTGYDSGKNTFSWDNYKWSNGSSLTLTKYCNNSSYGTVDNKTELDPEDDAAYVNWGSNWRMPTIAQFEELINSSYTTTTWTTQNGVYGRLVTSNSNGNSLFLPTAGCRYDSSLSSAGSDGRYWSRTLYTSSPNCARYLDFNSGNISASGYYIRYGGQSVRPVRLPE